MKSLTCPMCGGTLIPVPDQDYFVCDSCDTPTSLSLIDNDKIVQMKERANRLFLACDFDGAANLYQSVVAEITDDAESYWILALCTYGIQYVEDPITGKKIPTCHRTVHTSILNNEDYLNALDCADVLARKSYEEAARRIDQIQRGILSIVEKESPYDVFICYKETSATGAHTKESEIARDLYYKLTAANYRTFYAPISLQDKAGMEFEPFIFSALITAKIMFVIGFTREHYEAVWVKNEWSRFLARKAKNPRLLLIACYNSFLSDASEIPELLRKTQARDLANASTNDLVAEVQRKLPKDRPSVAKVQVDASNIMSSNASSMLKRAYIDLDNGDFSAAMDRFEKSSEMDPSLSKAYWGMLLAHFKCRNNTELVQLGKPIPPNMSAYRSAINTAQPHETEEYQEIVDSISRKITQTIEALKKKRSKEVMDTGVKAKLTQGEKNMKDLQAEYQQLISALKKLEDDLANCVADCRRVIDPYRDQFQQIASRVASALSTNKKKSSVTDDDKRTLLQTAEEDRKTLKRIAFEDLIHDKSKQPCYTRLRELLAEQKKLKSSLEDVIDRIQQQQDIFDLCRGEMSRIERRFQPSFAQVQAGDYQLSSQLLGK